MYCTLPSGTPVTKEMPTPQRRPLVIVLIIAASNAASPLYSARVILFNWPGVARNLGLSCLSFHLILPDKVRSWQLYSDLTEMLQSSSLSFVRALFENSPSSATARSTTRSAACHITRPGIGSTSTAVGGKAAQHISVSAKFREQLGALMKLLSETQVSREQRKILSLKVYNCWNLILNCPDGFRPPCAQF